MQGPRTPDQDSGTGTPDGLDDWLWYPGGQAEPEPSTASGADDCFSLPAVYPEGSAGRGGLFTRTAHFCAEWIFARKDRWILWVPLPFASGIAGYFQLRQEPPAGFWQWLVPVTVLLLFYGWRDLRDGAARGCIPVAIALFFLGASAAQYRVESVAAPVLAGETGPGTVTGRVIQVDHLRNGRRFLLENPVIEGLRPDQTPARVRITRRLKDDHPDFAAMAAIRPGEIVQVRAMLSPPAVPALPGGFDYPRHAWFQQLGGLGYALGPVEPLREDRSGVLPEDDVSLAVVSLRHLVTERILAALPGETGAVAAALITGARHGLEEETLDAMRKSGLAHLLAISGLHIGLIAGFVLFSLRAALAFWPWLALRVSLKKLAASLALVCAFFYLLLAGATIPTQRAFLMFAAMLMGVILDRSGISMRLVAWAAFVLLLFQPESLTGASFQLSFAAVIALIAGYEALQSTRIPQKIRERGLLWQVPAWFAGVMMTSLLASLATAPFTLLHFGQLPVFGLASNLLAMPVMAFWVMPWALCAMLLMPLGLESFALVPMGAGIDLVLANAKFWAGLPSSVLHAPFAGAGALPLVVIGGLWLCFWRGKGRLAGIILLVAGCSLALIEPKPDVLVARDGEVYAFRSVDGLIYMPRTGGRILRENWSRATGNDEAVSLPKAGTANEAGDIRCDGSGCSLSRDRQKIVWQSDPLEALEDCRLATMLVSPLDLSRICPPGQTGQALVLDRERLQKDQALAITFREGSLLVRSVAIERGERPWTRRDARF